MTILYIFIKALAYLVVNIVAGISIARFTAKIQDYLRTKLENFVEFSTIQAICVILFLSLIWSVVLTSIMANIW